MFLYMHNQDFYLLVYGKFCSLMSYEQKRDTFVHSCDVELAKMCSLIPAEFQTKFFKYDVTNVKLAVSSQQCVPQQ